MSAPHVLHTEMAYCPYAWLNRKYGWNQDKENENNIGGSSKYILYYNLEIQSCGLFANHQLGPRNKE